MAHAAIRGDIQHPGAWIIHPPQRAWLNCFKASQRGRAAQQRHLGNLRTLALPMLMDMSEDNGPKALHRTKQRHQGSSIHEIHAVQNRMPDPNRGMVQSHDQRKVTPLAGPEPLRQPGQLPGSELPSAASTAMAVEQQQPHPLNHQISGSCGATATQHRLQQQRVIMISRHQSHWGLNALFQCSP